MSQNDVSGRKIVEHCLTQKDSDFPLSQALIHVSTAYCNCDRTEISEVIYTTPYSPDDIFSLVNWLPEDMLDKVRDAIGLGCSSI